MAPPLPPLLPPTISSTTPSLPNLEPLLLLPPTYHIEDENPTQITIRAFLGVGNVMGLKFSDNAWSTTAANSYADGFRPSA
jgi:hypothetical protein